MSKRTLFTTCHLSSSSLFRRVQRAARRICCGKSFVPVDQCDVLEFSESVRRRLTIGGTIYQNQNKNKRTSTKRENEQSSSINLPCRPIYHPSSFTSYSFSMQRCHAYPSQHHHHPPPRHRRRLTIFMIRNSASSSPTPNDHPTVSYLT